ncbi:MAG: hypothetical protein JW862_15745 [Anaerolineales bacterium]|nr:hypothetical protein [Anaerolineales bacterium]
MHIYQLKVTRTIPILFATVLMLGLLILPNYSSVHAEASVIYVDADANAGGDGQSWGTAYQHLQAALDEASAGSGDYEIWVAEGIYTPTLETSAGNPRSVAFTLVEGTSLYGGFSGSEDSRSQRDWENHLTILSGDLAGDDLTDPGGLVRDTANIVGDNAHNVLIGGGVSASVELDGFTVTAGDAKVTGFNAGGGMYNESSSPTLTNLVFIGNMAKYGGGMLNYQGSTPSLTHVSFYSNTATTQGGGVLNDGSAATFTDVTFENNFSDDYGGGAFNVNCSPSFTNVTFTGNSVTGRFSYGGGMYNQSTSAYLANVTFIANSAGLGGGMLNWKSNPSITAGLFYANTAYEGGGIYSDDSDLTITATSFLGNTAIYNGGGIYNTSSKPELVNVLFSGNSAGDYGGGLFMTGPYDKPDLINVTFSGNQAGDNGGGMSNYGNQPSLVNTLFWGNTAPSGSQIYNHDTLAKIAYSDVQGSGGSGPGWNLAVGLDMGGNIDADPGFVDADGPDNTFGTPDDNARLSGTSAAIDAGDNTAVPGSISTDLAGNPRFVDIVSVPDSGNGSAPYVDMGAYETQLVDFFVFLPLNSR